MGNLSLQELSAIYALADAEGIGLHRMRTLLLQFGSASAILEASSRELTRVEGVDRILANTVLRTAVHAEHRRKAQRIKDSGVRLIHILSDNYPDRLREIPDAPVLLYGMGEISWADPRAIAVVGTRSSSRYGHQITRQLTRELVKQGFTIVSGLARGIDTEAHRAALEAGGKTIAVLGSGLDEIYPKENLGLAREIAQQGCVCTEYYLGEMPDAPHFPQRNRIISGLSQGTLVVEAGDKSGAILTALLALEQNREVFAVPGPIDSKRSIGTNRLIKHGAKLVQSVEDILDELSGQLSLGLGGDESSPTPELTGPEREIYALLSDRPQHIDEIASLLRQSPATVLATLLALELRDITEQLPGTRFIRRN